MGGDIDYNSADSEPITHSSYSEEYDYHVAVGAWAQCSSLDGNKAACLAQSHCEYEDDRAWCIKTDMGEVAVGGWALEHIRDAESAVAQTDCNIFNYDEE